MVIRRLADLLFLVIFIMLLLHSPTLCAEPNGGLKCIQKELYFPEIDVFGNIIRFP